MSWILIKEKRCPRGYSVVKTKAAKRILSKKKWKGFRMCLKY